MDKLRYALLGRIAVQDALAAPVPRGSRCAVDNFGSAYLAVGNCVYTVPMTNLLRMASKYHASGTRPPVPVEPMDAIAKLSDDVLFLEFSP